MYIGLHVQYPLFLSDLMKIRPVGADLSYMTKLIVAFRNFANAPKKG